MKRKILFNIGNNKIKVTSYKDGEIFLDLDAKCIRFLKKKLKKDFIRTNKPLELKFIDVNKLYIFKVIDSNVHVGDSNVHVGDWVWFDILRIIKNDNLDVPKKIDLGSFW